MPRVVWSPAALRSLARLNGFLESRDKEAAKRAVRTIRQGIRILEAHPEVGRPAENTPLPLREWRIGLGGSGYFILALRHAKESGY